jgi:hypothetical protein
MNDNDARGFRRIVAAGLLLLTMAFPANAKYSGGTGTAADPYQIGTAADLIALSQTSFDYGRHFILTADLDLDPNLPFDKAVIAPDTDPAKNGFQGIAFGGVFDGDGHTISHLTVKGKGYVGLFGEVAAGAEVRDLGIVDVNSLSSGNYIGGLVAENSGKLIHCYSTGTVKGDGYAGGLAGSNERGSVVACYSMCAVSGSVYVGGLVGHNGGTIMASYSTGPVKGNGYAGGLVGWNYDSVTNSVWDMETSGLPASAGGVGLTTAEMRDAYMLGLNGFGGRSDWILDAGQDYPTLAWQGKPGTAIPEPNVDWMNGRGTPEEPYRIDTTEQLIFLGRAGALCDRHFVLTADLDLDPRATSGRVFPQALIPALTGSFDGNGHSISNLTISGGGCLGLFGQLGPGGELSNIRVLDVNIRGLGDSIGGLLGLNLNGTVSNSCVTGSVTGDKNEIGGLVGSNSGTIANCSSKGSVSGQYTVGGLAGSNDTDAAVSNSYSRTSVGGNTFVGGLVGANLGAISNSYSAGPVSGSTFVGGLVGLDWSATASRCFWDTQTSTQTQSAGGTGKTTDLMKTGSTFVKAGWDFTNLWDICEGVNYPRLRWQASRLDVRCPYGVDFEDFSHVAAYWLMRTCSSDNDNCHGSDLDESGSVDVHDLIVFAQGWLSE